MTCPEKKSILDSVLGYVKDLNSFNSDNVSAIIYDREVGVVIFCLNGIVYFLSSETYESLGCF